MNLVINNKPAKSIFRITGNSENSLTSALCTCLMNSKTLLRWILGYFEIKYLTDQKLINTNIGYQNYGEILEEGITDLELWYEDLFHIIIEAKIGANYPEIGQCKKYIPHLREVHHRALGVLLDSADRSIIEHYSKDRVLSGIIKPILWGDIYAECQSIIKYSSNKVEKYFLKEFCRFMEEEYYMKSYEEEVWIVPVNTEPLNKTGISFLKIHEERMIYFHPSKRSRRKSIYFAPRFNGRVFYVQRIQSIEYEKYPKDYIPELRSIEWANKDLHTIFHLGKPIELPQPVKSGPIRNSVAYSDFDILITSKTVKEARERTARRKRE